jgi:GNAT superfamily N-acetyltransferase
MVGTAGFDRMERLRTRHRGYLEQVYVNANYRGQGAGLRLLRALIDEAFRLEGLEQISLGVVAGNTPASSAMYCEKCGRMMLSRQPADYHPRVRPVSNESKRRALWILLPAGIRTWSSSLPV